jgi:hypothetical protein
MPRSTQNQIVFCGTQSGPFTTTGKVGPIRLWLGQSYHFHQSRS